MGWRMVAETECITVPTRHEQEVASYLPQFLEKKLKILNYVIPLFFYRYYFYLKVIPYSFLQ
jgi:hypothetical protein